MPYACPGAENNYYEIDATFVRGPMKGHVASKDGATIGVFAPDMVTALEMFAKEKKRQGWGWAVPSIIDVKLEQAPWAEGKITGDRGKGVTVWYNNLRMGMSLRLR